MLSFFILILGLSIFELGFCFTNDDFLEVQTVHNDLYVAVLITNATPLFFCFFTD